MKKLLLVLVLSSSLIQMSANACPGMKNKTSKSKQKTEIKVNDNSNILFTIEGMHCQSCVNLATKTILSISGVKSAKVDLVSKEAIVKLSSIGNKNTKLKEIKTSLQEEGFEVSGLNIKI
ncbi:MAG: heavy-metal-associated domain-containing protein [Candidatus Sericytochromatia bacterium]